MMNVQHTKPALYQAIWRWHFYAGLICLPILVSLAVTGALYLFKDEINVVVHRDILVVEPDGDVGLLPAAIVALAEQSAGGTAVAYVAPPSADRSARVHVATPSGTSRDIFVDPYRGKILGDLPQGDYGNLPFINLIRHLHSMEYFGWLGNRIVEIVAGWTLILVSTGIYLWWPRGQNGGVVTVRTSATNKRRFWRDLHAVTGVFAGAVIFFLAATGMPWTGFWGEHFKNAVNTAGLGYPQGFWYPVQASRPPAGHAHGQTAWILEGAPVPVAAPVRSDAIGIDAAVRKFTEIGIARGYTVTLPTGPSGVYSATVVPDLVAEARTVHLDQYTGEVLFDAGFADFGVLAQAIELGTSIHTGQQFGRLNQWLMLLACFAIVLLAVTAGVMWWIRKPRGRLGAPSYAQDYRVTRTVVIITTVVGIALPLVGLSIVLVLVLDRILPRRLLRNIS
jgi:uncharacterized iron-regulated membrane protein